MTSSRRIDYTIASKRWRVSRWSSAPWIPDFCATVHSALGIDPHKHLYSGHGRSRSLITASLWRSCLRNTGIASESPALAVLVTFVASPLSAATNGAALRADGGVVRSII